MSAKPSLHLLLMAVLFSGCLLLSACSKEASKTQHTSAQEKTNFKEIEANYESCAVYASVTRFYFQPSEGNLIEVTVFNEGMDEYPSPIKIPGNLLDDIEDSEGPPGANPALVGKKFKLIYNATDELIEIRPAY